MRRVAGWASGVRKELVREAFANNAGFTIGRAVYRGVLESGTGGWYTFLYAPPRLNPDEGGTVSSLQQFTQSCISSGISDTRLAHVAGRTQR